MSFISGAEWSLGDHIEMSDGAGGFDRIPELRNIQFNRGNRTRVDSSSHDSEKPYRNTLPTFLEDGNITADGNFLPHDPIHMALEEKLDDDESTTYRYVIEADDGDVIYEGNAHLTQLNPTSNFEDARRIALILTMDGAWPRIS